MEQLEFYFFFLQNYSSPVDSGIKNSEASVKFMRNCFTKSRLQTEKQLLAGIKLDIKISEKIIKKGKRITVFGASLN